MVKAPDSRVKVPSSSPNKRNFYYFNIKNTVLYIRGSPEFWFGGDIRQNFSEVAIISVRGSDIQQKLTQRRLLKNFEKFI